MGSRRVVAGLLAVLVVLFAPAARAKDDLVIGVAQAPAGLHPYYDPLAVKAYLLGFALRPVTAFDKDWKLVCLLCTEVPTLGNGLVRHEARPGGGQGLAVTLRLKPDLKWGDGVPVTAEDVLFTWKLGRDPLSGFPRSRSWSRAASVDVLDAHTVVLHLDRVRADYGQWDWLLPAHLERPVFDLAATYDDYAKQSRYVAAPATPGLYDGPYLLSDYEPGKLAVFTPNPNWPGIKPGFRRIEVRVYDSTAALRAALLAGEVDLAPGEGIGLTIDQVLALRKSQPDRFTYLFRPSLTYEHIDLQANNPILADIRVRRALLIALDRQTLVDKLFDGMQPVADTWVNPLDPYFSKDIPRYPYDPNLARAMLAEAGWRPGDDGVCRNAAGDRLSLEITTTAGNRLREFTEQILQTMWRTACIEVTIHNQPAATLFGETLKKRLFKAMAMYAWTTGVGESPRAMLASTSIPTAANNWGGNNTIGFDDPRMDGLIAMAESELGPAREKQIWADMQKIYAEQLRALPLFFRAEPHVVPKWLAGYAPTGHSDLGTLFSENWRPR